MWLLGPPGLYPLDHSTDQGLSTYLEPSFIDVLMANYDKLQFELPMGLTENGSATFLSTGNPCLDFFFHIVPDTLKLIYNLRGIRGTGKSDKEGFYTAALWLHVNHPKTLACNLRWFADFGYFKDLPEILFKLLEGPAVLFGSNKKESKGSRINLGSNKGDVVLLKLNEFRKARKPQRIKSTVPREERILAEEEKVNLEKENARRLRKEKIAEKARRAHESYSRDPDYRFLHDRISQVFAEFLISDLQYLNSGEIRKISLASKWCPNLDSSSFDQSTLLCGWHILEICHNDHCGNLCSRGSTYSKEFCS